MSDINNRIDKFFSENEYDLEVQMALEYLTDTNQKIFLYPVDNSQSNLDDLYHETYKNETVLKDPIELNGLIELLEPKNQAYNDDNTLRINEMGNLLVHVLVAELKMLQCKPKFGDYMVYMVDDGINEPFPLVFQIANDGNRYFENVRSWGGFKSHFRTFVCTPVDKNELSFG